MFYDLRTKCDGCIWYGKCSGQNGCDDYAPYDDADDREIETLIELRRDEYRRAWMDYVSQYE